MTLPTFRFLVSYYYIDDRLLNLIRELKKSYPIEFFLDSGAFTAWTKGKIIPLGEYKDFLRKNGDVIDRYFTLDIVGNAERTKEQYHSLLADGFKPIPIFTTGEGLQEIDEYYKTSDLVGIGGIVGASRGDLKVGYLKAIHNTVAGRRVHLLGSTDDITLNYFKPYSCDSSSAFAGVRFGHMCVWNERTKRVLNLQRKDFKAKPSHDIMVALKSFGYSPYDFLKPESWNGQRSLINYVSLRSYLRAQQYYFDALNVRMMIAIPNLRYMQVTSEQYKKELEFLKGVSHARA